MIGEEFFSVLRLAFMPRNPGLENLAARIDAKADAIANGITGQKDETIENAMRRIAGE